MATLQIKGLDPTLLDALKSRAKRERRSVSQQVIVIIQDYLWRPGYSPKEATEAFLAMTWADDRPAEEITKELRAQRHSGRRDKILSDINLLPPITRSLVGVLKNKPVSEEDHRRDLRKKLLKKPQ